jgi:hypothetical protein
VTADVATVAVGLFVAAAAGLFFLSIEVAEDESLGI